MLNRNDFQTIMIFKCERLYFANYFQMRKIIIWLWLLNDYDIQTITISKWLWYSNANDIQMRKIIIWNANVNKNKYQMRINIKCE